MLVKSFTDELAWKVQRELVSHYFRVQQESMVTSSNQLGGIVKGIVNKALVPIKEQFETQIKTLCAEISFLKSSYDLISSSDGSVTKNYLFVRSLCSLTQSSTVA